MNSSPFQQNATMANANLPDELWNIRNTIKALKKEEEKLIAEIKETGDCVGQKIEAQVVTETQSRMKTKEVKEYLGDRLDDFYEDKEIVKVKLKEHGQ